MKLMEVNESASGRVIYLNPMHILSISQSGPGTHIRLNVSLSQFQADQKDHIMAKENVGAVRNAFAVATAP